MRKALSIILALSVIGMLSISPANAVIKAGATCKSKGQKISAQGKSYICSKSGKKLVWIERISVVDNSILLSPLYSALTINVFETRVNDYSFISNPGVNSALIPNCMIKNKYLYGKIGFIDDLNKANLKAFASSYVTRSDLRVVFVSEGKANSCGLWQIAKPWDRPDLLIALVNSPENADFVFSPGF